MRKVSEKRVQAAKIRIAEAKLAEAKANLKKLLRESEDDYCLSKKSATSLVHNLLSMVASCVYDGDDRSLEDIIQYQWIEGAYTEGDPQPFLAGIFEEYGEETILNELKERFPEDFAELEDFYSRYQEEGYEAVADDPFMEKWY